MKSCVILLFLIVSGTPSEDSGRATLDSLAKKYSLTVHTRELKPSRGITAQEASAAEIAAYAPVLASEWNLYPPELIQLTKLTNIVLCKDLAFAGQKRAAIPDFRSNTLYLDVVRGNYAPSYVRKVIHHEYFHIIDIRDDGLLYKDERWAMLNPKDFKYGNGGKNVQNDSSVSLLRDDQPGFLNRYSMAGVEEDKAEIFAHMIVEPLILEKRMAKDPVLKAKVERMRELLTAFCPQMNEEFWKQVQAVKR